MTLYRETPCSGCGGFGIYGQHHVNTPRGLLCSGPGGSREEVTIDYEAAGRRLAKKVTGANRAKVSVTSKLAGHWIRDVVDAALGTDND